MAWPAGRLAQARRGRRRRTGTVSSKRVPPPHDMAPVPVRVRSSLRPTTPRPGSHSPAPPRQGRLCLQGTVFGPAVVHGPATAQGLANGGLAFCRHAMCGGHGSSARPQVWQSSMRRGASSSRTIFARVMAAGFAASAQADDAIMGFLGGQQAKARGCSPQLAAGDTVPLPVTASRSTLAGFWTSSGYPVTPGGRGQSYPVKDLDSYLFVPFLRSSRSAAASSSSNRGQVLGRLCGCGSILRQVPVRPGWSRPCNRSRASLSRRGPLRSCRHALT